MLDFLSVLFGLLAWGIPIRAMTTKHIQKGFHYVILSLGACTFSIQFQVLKVIFDLYGVQKTVEDTTFSFIQQSLALMIIGTALFLGMSIYVKNKHKK